MLNSTTVAEAQANFTIRLAPGQEVNTIRSAAERLLRQAAPAGAGVDLRFGEGFPAAVIDTEAPAIRVAKRAFVHAFGREPLVVRAGGTLPIVAAPTERGMPVVLTGFALPESNVHAPNEKLPVEYLAKAYDAARGSYLAFAHLHD